MQILLDKPQFKRFIRAQVVGGQFPSPMAVVEAALSQWMFDETSPAEFNLAMGELEQSIERKGTRGGVEVFESSKKMSDIARGEAGK